MARRYTAEQACKAILNDDDLGEMESADSLDESFSNTSSSSCSEIDSDPENDYCGRVLNVVTPPERGRPRTRTLNAQRIKGGVRVRGGRSRAQPAITCSKLTIETLEQGVKYVQS